MHHCTVLLSLFIHYLLHTTTTAHRKIKIHGNYIGGYGHASYTKHNVNRTESTRNCSSNNATCDAKGFHYRPIPNVPAKKTVTVGVYMEAQCGDTSRFVHKQLLPLWEELATSRQMFVKLVPFGKARCVPHDDDYSCHCQHGVTECELNQLMNCVIKYVGDPYEYMPMISCIQGLGKLGSAFEKCFGKARIPKRRFAKCATSVEGRKMLHEAGLQTAKLSPPLAFVPTITLNGNQSLDAFYNLKQGVCELLEPKPSACLK